MLLLSEPVTVTKKPDRRGERGISVKTIRVRECRAISGATVVDLLVCSTSSHTRLRVRWAPGIPHALIGRMKQQPGRVCRRGSVEACGFHRERNSPCHSGAPERASPESISPSVLRHDGFRVRANARPGTTRRDQGPRRYLVPTFRSSCSIAAPTFTNFGKSWALANLL